jgi:hypothetical protein
VQRQIEHHRPGQSLFDHGHSHGTGQCPRAQQSSAEVALDDGHGQIKEAAPVHHRHVRHQQGRRADRAADLGHPRDGILSDVPGQAHRIGGQRRCGEPVSVNVDGHDASTRDP